MGVAYILVAEARGRGKVFIVPYTILFINCRATSISCLPGGKNHRYMPEVYNFRSPGVWIPGKFCEYDL